MQEHINVRMPDDTIIFVRKFAGDDSRAFVVFPTLGESVDDEFYASLQKVLPSNTQYFIELRGHKHSQGTHTLKDHWQDIHYWMTRLSKEHEEVFVLAKGLSASLLLKYEDQAHYVDPKSRPALPDGMVLFAPVFEGRNLSTTDHEVHHFHLPPVRIQTPTRIFMGMDDYTVEHIKRFFGTFLVYKAKWLHQKPMSRVERALGLHKVKQAVHEVVDADRPIRFSAKW